MPPWLSYISGMPPLFSQLYGTTTSHQGTEFTIVGVLGSGHDSAGRPVIMVLAVASGSEFPAPTYVLPLSYAPTPQTPPQPQ